MASRIKDLCPVVRKDPINQVAPLQSIRDGVQSQNADEGVDLHCEGCYAMMLYGISLRSLQKLYFNSKGPTVTRCAGCEQYVLISTHGYRDRTDL
jgi:hypothetical protein